MIAKRKKTRFWSLSDLRPFPPDGDDDKFQIAKGMVMTKGGMMRENSKTILKFEERVKTRREQ